MHENYDILRCNTTDPLPPNMSDPTDTCEGCSSRMNKLDKEAKISPPIFLKKNLKLMMRKRDVKAVQKKNGLTHRILPAMGNIMFDSQTEDSMTIKRKNTIDMS